jgi:RNA polymerase sigma-70 factor (ECF subfamily)
MTVPHQSDGVLVARIGEGDAEAWRELIGRFEGRLLAYVSARTHNRAAAEDIVQETFVGLLTSLPNFDRRRPLETYLFSIAAHKLTDWLRREGRRPTLPLMPVGPEGSDWEVPGSARPASSIARSVERRNLEDGALVAALGEQLDAWRQQGQWLKIECCELLFVRGWANKDVAAQLGIGEQMVANHKYEMLAKLRAHVRNQGLPEDVFPDLYADQ